MSKLKYPFALDDCGEAIFPEAAEKGKKYRCPVCKALGLILICPTDAKWHFRSLKDVHTGSLCKKIERKKDVSVIDKNTLKRNCMRPPQKSQEEPDEGEIKHPGSPRKPSERATWCPTLEAIIQLELDRLDDFAINEKEKLSDHFISTRNAYLVMDRNEALGPRALEVILGDAIPETKTIRCYLRAEEVQQEDRHLAEQKVFDLIATDQEQFDLACSMFFETFEEFGPNVVLGSKYRRAFVFGDFHLPRQGDNQAGINGCSMDCRSGNASCTGRQESALVNSMKQIAVSEQDLVDNDVAFAELESFGIVECRNNSNHNHKDDSPTFKVDEDAALIQSRLHDDYNNSDMALVENGGPAGKTEELSNQNFYDRNDRTIGSVHHSTVAEAVAWAMSNRIADDIIKSDADWNRRSSLADAITFIWRAMGSPYPVYANDHHNKLEKRFYYYLPLIWASKNRIVPNKRGSWLRINAKCTRGDFLAYLWSALFLGISELSYEQIYRNAIEWAYREKYVYGIDDGQFITSQPITYSEAVLFLYRAIVSGR